MLDPRLRDKPIAVCGCTEDRHGIVLAKSEKAKKAGIKTGMVNWEAERLCKDPIIVPPQYDQYLKYSKLTRSIYQRYTDLIEPFGMDECWLDVSHSARTMGTAIQRLRTERDRLDKDSQGIEQRKAEIARMTETFAGIRLPLTEYDDTYVRQLLERISVYRDRVVFRFKDGREVTVEE